MVLAMKFSGGIVVVTALLFAVTGQQGWLVFTVIMGLYFLAVGFSWLVDPYGT